MVLAHALVVSWVSPTIPCFTGVCPAFGRADKKLPTIGYGVGHINITGYPDWAWIFLLNGALTILAGIVFLIVSPNSPDTAKFLTPAERKVALERVRGNQSSLENRTM